MSTRGINIISYSLMCWKWRNCRPTYQHLHIHLLRWICRSW